MYRYISLAFLFLFSLSFPVEAAKKKKEAVRKIALEKEREYKEWYEKLKKSTLFKVYLSR